MNALQIVSFTGPCAALRIADSNPSLLSCPYVITAPYVRALYPVNNGSSFGYGNISRWNLPDGRRSTIVRVQTKLERAMGITSTRIDDYALVPGPAVGINFYPHAEESNTGSASGTPFLQVAANVDMPIDLRLGAGVRSISAVGISFYDSTNFGGAFGRDMSALTTDLDVPLYTLTATLLLRHDEAG